MFGFLMLLDEIITLVAKLYACVRMRDGGCLFFSFGLIKL